MVSYPKLAMEDATGEHYEEEDEQDLIFSCALFHLVPIGAQHHVQSLSKNCRLLPSLSLSVLALLASTPYAQAVLAKILEGLPLLNELLRDTVLGGDSGGLQTGVIVLRADGGVLFPGYRRPLPANRRRLSSGRVSLPLSRC